MNEHDLVRALKDVAGVLAEVQDAADLRGQDDIALVLFHLRTKIAEVLYTPEKGTSVAYTLDLLERL